MLTPRVHCPSCGQSQPRLIGPIAPAASFAGRQLAEPLEGGSLYKCPACFLGFRYPSPAKEEIGRLYQTGSSTHWQYALEDRTDWQIACAFLGGLDEEGAILDVGCYDGAFLGYVGSGWKKYGVEMNSTAAERAKAQGVEVIAPDLADLPHMEYTFDVVAAFDVVEHVADPRAFLFDLAARVRPGGHVIIGTGDIEAPTWRLMGSRYWYCTIPEHLAFISERWSRAAAEVTGLRVVHVSRFAHEAGAPLQAKAEQACKNLLLRFAPGLFGMLRRWGLGLMDVSAHPELSLSPPPWPSARDHLLVVFRK